MKLPSYSEVELTDHVQEKPIPDFEVENILEKQQGEIFKDLEKDTWLFKKDQTIVVADIQEEKAIAVTAYRKNGRKFFCDRYIQLRSPT